MTATNTPETPVLNTTSTAWSWSEMLAAVRDLDVKVEDLRQRVSKLETEMDKLRRRVHKLEGRA
jgi:cell division protein FtsB